MTYLYYTLIGGRGFMFKFLIYSFKSILKVPSQMKKLSSRFN